VYKLSGFIRYAGCELSVNQVCLVLDLLASVIRLVFLIDPLGFWSILTIETSADVVSLSSPFSLASVLLIAFYWSNLIESFGGFSKANNWLQNKKKPYLITVTIVFVLLLGLCILDLVTPGQGLQSLLVLAVLGIVSFAIALFFIFNGIKILRVLYGPTTSLSVRKSGTAKKVTWLVGSLGFSLLGEVVALILLASPLNGSSNGAVIGTQFHLFVWMFTVSFIVVCAFQSPKAALDSSATGQGTGATANTGNTSKSSASSGEETSAEYDKHNVKLKVLDDKSSTAKSDSEKEKDSKEDTDKKQDEGSLAQGSTDSV
jgi:hypothetical protein